MSATDLTPVLTWVHAQMAAITAAHPASAFTASDARFRMDREYNEASTDRIYSVAPMSIGPEDAAFGRGEVVRNLSIGVRVFYMRPSEAASVAEREANQQKAALDMLLVSDRIANPLNYDGANTGVTMVTARGVRLVGSQFGREIWQADFAIQWRGPVLL